ncbi:hypothetical protein [Photorhabdus heterorhabditis]|uniref:hypothetical protein n=1 Tax=Photorhabdus heterorhabditis TaxID=880156 RepID=UPI001FD44300|nr:hypothetical protein [Photorhabdus heterorhabditis]
MMDRKMLLARQRQAGKMALTGHCRYRLEVRRCGGTGCVQLHWGRTPVRPV